MEATEGGYIDVDGMRLWKVVTLVKSGNDRWPVAALLLKGLLHLLLKGLLLCIGCCISC